MISWRGAFQRGLAGLLLVACAGVAYANVYGALVAGIDFADLISALVGVATLVVGVLVVTRGVRWIKSTISYEPGGGDFSGARSVDPYLDEDGRRAYLPEDWTMADLADASKRGDYGASEEFERRWRESIEP